MKDSTKQKYEQLIKKLAGMKNNSEIDKFINDKAQSTKQLYYSAIIYDKGEKNILKYNKTVEQLKEDIKTIRKKLDTIEAKNEIKDNEKDKFLEWNSIIKARNELVNVKGTLEEKLIYGLYTYIPPRRLLDYVELHYYTQYPAINEIDKNKNYLILSDDKPQIIFNRHKNDHTKTLGIQTIDIKSVELVQLFKNYIQETGLNPKDKVFRYSNSDKMYRKLQRMFMKYTKKNISVNILRHSYISHAQKSGQLETKEQRIKLSELMGHSIMTQLEYYRK